MSDQGKIKDPPLTQEMMDRITLEEQFRVQVQKRLKESSTNNKKWWEFLNSSFGLWLLSLFFITVLGGLYTRYQSYRAEDARNKALIKRLDSEIGYRYFQVITRLHQISQPEYIVEVSIAEDVDWCLHLLDMKPGYNIDYAHPLYDEFSNSPTVSLIADQQRYLELEGANVEEIAGVSRQLTAELSKRKEKRGEELQLIGKEKENVHKAAALILSRLMAESWKKTNFKYLNCSNDKPFCEE